MATLVSDTHALATATLAGATEIRVVDDPAGTPASKKTTVTGIAAFLASLTQTFTNKTYDTAGTGNSFLINGVAATANTGTGAVARAAGPTFTTPTLGVATATSLNGNTFTTGTYTLTGTAGKTLTFSNSVTLAGTDGTTMTFPSTTGTVAILGLAQTWSAAQTNSTAGAASTPAQYFTGAIFTGGSGTTNFPHIFVQPTGATANTAWSTAGTVFGVNMPTGYTGNYADFGLGGVSKFSINSAGRVFAGTGDAIGGFSGLGETTAIIFRSGGIEIYNASARIGYFNSSSFALGSAFPLAWSSSTDPTSSRDTFLIRDAANTIALRNSTNAQAFNVYNTYTDASNYERLAVKWTTNVADIIPQALGTGTTRTLRLNRLKDSTGAGSALLGANSPAATLTAPYAWAEVTTSDGSTAYIPMWK